MTETLEMLDDNISSEIKHGSLYTFKVYMAGKGLEDLYDEIDHIDFVEAEET